MSISRLMQRAAAGAGGEVPAVEDVFSTYLYKGNGTSQTITNGINLEEEGGLIWIKRRDSSADSHALYDSERPLTKKLDTSSTSEQVGVPLGVTGYAEGNGKYLVSTAFGLLISTDATNWSEVSGDVSNDSGIFRLEFLGGKFVALSISGEFYSSTDGVTWASTFVSSSISASYQIFYENNTYLLNRISGSTVFASSDGGSTWTEGTSPGIKTHLASVGGKFLTFDGNGGGTHYQSSDGLNWTALGFSPESGVTKVFRPLNSNRLIVQIGYVDFYQSTDGTNFSSMYSGGGLQFVSKFAYADTTDRYVIITSGFAGGVSRTLTSTGGSSWSANTTSIPSDVQGPMASDGSVFMLGTNGASYYTNTDGNPSNWTTRASPAGVTDTSDLLQSGSSVMISQTSNFFTNSTVSNPSTWSKFPLTSTPVYQFNEDGFTGGSTETNRNGAFYTSWTFRKAPKFFDVVTYTGDGTSGRAISHNLGTTVGSIIVKRTDSSGAWSIYHRGMDATAPEDYALEFTTAARTGTANRWADTAPTSTTFTVGSDGEVNASGGTYVAYLFAHHDGGQDIIKCGSYTGNGSADGPEIDLGFEPQWVLIKRADGGTAPWILVDTMRGMPVGGNDAILYPNYSSGEDDADNFIAPTATGFKIEGNLYYANTSGDNYIYIAIRRGPMKAPESGTEVFAPVEYSGNDTTREITSGFVTDLVLSRNIGSSKDTLAHDRIRGGDARFKTNENAAETTGTYSRFDTNTGWILESSYQNVASDPDYITWMFRRAPGFFDVVAYTGNGTSGRTVDHNLGVVPELMIVKGRDASGTDWTVYNSASGATKYLQLNTTNAIDNDSGYWNNTAPTESVFTVGDSGSVNGSSNSFVAYLFATLPGVSKVGSYTGDNTTTINVDCGFSTGARFVLIKDTTGTGSWYVFDTARGIVAGDDPDLELDTTSAESNYDALDPLSSGFIVNPTSININETGRTYIFLAIA